MSQLQQFLSLNINKNTLKHHTSSSLSTLINTQRYLLPLHDLLSHFNLNVNPKYIYLCYLISAFHDDFFYNSDPLLELLLIYQSRKIINLFECFTANTYNISFVLHLDSFIDNFKSWQAIDASLFTSFLQNSHSELDVLKDLSSETINENIQTKQQFIQNRIKSMKKHYPNMPDTDSSKLQSVAEKAFWDILKDSLKRFESKTLTPQDVKWVTSIIDEIRNLINSLTPNNSDFIKETNETLDIPFISQRMEHNLMDPTYLNSLLFFIIARIQKLQSASEDAHTNKWMSITTQLLELNCHYYDLLPVFFQTTYSKLFKIQSQLQDLASNIN